MQWIFFSCVLPEKKTGVFKHSNKNYTLPCREKSKQMFVPALRFHHLRHKHSLMVHGDLCVLVAGLMCHQIFTVDPSSHSGSWSDLCFLQWCLGNFLTVSFKSHPAGRQYLPCLSQQLCFPCNFRLLSSTSCTQLDHGSACHRCFGFFCYLIVCIYLFNKSPEKYV